MKNIKEQQSNNTNKGELSTTDRTDNNWILHEVKYWEAAYDRVMQDYLRTQKAHDDWKNAHENVIQQIQQCEVWDDDKRKEIDRLNKLTNVFETDHKKLEEKIKQWETWYKSLEKDRDLYKQWDSDKRKEIERINQSIDELQHARQFWQDEHAKVVTQVQQWVAWFQDMQSDRDSFRKMAEEKQRIIGQQQAWIEKLFKNPLHYLGVLIHKILKLEIKG